MEQIPWIRKVLEALRIPVLEYPRFEADDVIGTLACRAVEQGAEVVIVSSDKDMLQLVNDRVQMLNPMKDDMWFDAEATEKFMGVRPGQVADLLALKGDSIDNIPGAPGIGEKGAKDLILRFGSVENAIEHAEEVERRTYRESLQTHRDQILLSKKLATIHCEVPIEFTLDSVEMQEPDLSSLRELYKTLEFSGPLKEIGPRPAVKREYQTLDSEAALDDWIASLPANASPLAVAAGEMMSSNVLGFAAEGGDACSLASNRIPERATIAHDIKNLLRRFGDAPGLEHDVMLYAFLLSADPARCDLSFAG